MILLHISLGFYQTVFIIMSLWLDATTPTCLEHSKIILHLQLKRQYLQQPYWR